MASNFAYILNVNTENVENKYVSVNELYIDTCEDYKSKVKTYKNFKYIESTVNPNAVWSSSYIVSIPFKNLHIGKYRLSFLRFSAFNTFDLNSDIQLTYYYFREDKNATGIYNTNTTENLLYNGYNFYQGSTYDNYNDFKFYPNINNVDSIAHFAESYPMYYKTNIDFTVTNNDDVFKFKCYFPTVSSNERFKYDKYTTYIGNITLEYKL